MKNQLVLMSESGYSSKNTQIEEYKVVLDVIGANDGILSLVWNSGHKSKLAYVTKVNENSEKPFRANLIENSLNNISEYSINYEHAEPVTKKQAKKILHPGIDNFYTVMFGAMSFTGFCFSLSGFIDKAFSVYLLIACGIIGLISIGVDLNEKHNRV